MNVPWWEHVIIFLGALIFVLVWIVKYIDYDNLKKWRWGIWKEKWTLKAKRILFTMVTILTYSVYRILIRLSH